MKSITTKLIWGVACYCSLSTAAANPRTIVPTTVDTIVAKVDHHAIFLSDLMQGVQQMTRQQQKDTPALRRQVLKLLIEQKVVLVHGNKPPTLAQEITRQREHTLQRMCRELGSKARLEKAVGQPMHELRQHLTEKYHQELVLRHTQQEVTHDAHVTPKQVHAFFRQLHPKKRQQQLPATWVIEAVDYHALQDQTQYPELIQQLKAFKKRIEQGEDFIQLAEKYADDATTALPIDQLSFVDRGDLEPTYERAALQLQPGQISQPVALQTGFALIQLLARAGNKYKSRYLLCAPSQQQQEKATRKVFQALIKQKRQNPHMTLAQAVRKSSVKSALKHHIITNDKGEQYLVQDALPQALKNHPTTLTPGEATEPITHQTSEGLTVQRVFFVHSYQPAHCINLQQDYIILQEMALSAQKSALFARWLKQHKEKSIIYIHPDYR